MIRQIEACFLYTASRNSTMPVYYITKKRAHVLVHAFHQEGTCSKSREHLRDCPALSLFALAKLGSGRMRDVRQGNSNAECLFDQLWD